MTLLVSKTRTALAGLLVLTPVLTAGESVRVSAAASLANVLGEIHSRFEAETGINTQLHLGGSNIVARQIKEGAPTDVFFSASSEIMDTLEMGGLIESGTRKDPFSNSLVVVVPADSRLAMKSIRDLANDSVRRITTGDPKAVPVGIYARRYFEKIGLWSLLKRRIVACENVRAALAAVEAGNADAAIVYRTDAALSTKVRIAVAVPPAEGPPISYSVAAVKGARNHSAARRYLDFLDTPAASQVIQKFGFTVPARPVPDSESPKSSDADRSPAR